MINSKIAGIKSLIRNGLPVPKTWFLETGQEDLEFVHGFLDKQNPKAQWVIRNLVDSYKRYEAGNKIFTTEQILTSLNNLHDFIFPSAIQSLRNASR